MFPRPYGNIVFPGKIAVSPESEEALGAMALAVGFGLSSMGSATYPTAELALFYPFVLSVPMVAAQIYWVNGAAVSGNVDSGIYTNDGTLIVSTGSTAQSGTNTFQVVNITDTLLDPGQYYMAIVLDNTTGTLNRATNATAPRSYPLGLAQMATAFPLPATATLATTQAAYLPLHGFTSNATF